MIRLSHTNLEAVRRNPSALAMLSQRRYSGPGRFWYVKAATKAYHSGGLQDAVDYVEDAFQRRGFRMKHFDTYADYLVGYDRAFACLGAEPVEFNLRIEVPAAADVVLSGEVSRVDLDATGYSAWIFAERFEPAWRQELRMPLIQAEIANVMGAPLNDVHVGVYAFSDEVYDRECYRPSVVSRAHRELRNLANALPR